MKIPLSRSNQYSQSDRSSNDPHQAMFIMIVGLKGSSSDVHMDSNVIKDRHIGTCKFLPYKSNYLSESSKKYQYSSITGM